MLWQNRQNDDNSETDVNVTPLIDVSLVLVVILLLATPIAFESGIGVKSAVSTTQQVTSELENKLVELTLVDEGHVRVNSTVVSREQLIATLQPLLDQTSERSVMIACGDGISHGAFVDVLDKAKRSGAAGIAVSGR